MNTHASRATAVGALIVQSSIGIALNALAWIMILVCEANQIIVRRSEDRMKLLYALTYSAIV